MDIVKTFNIFDKEMHININGTLDEPLFQANQIGDILNISNIFEIINDFEEDERKIYNNNLFITEIGLYRLMGMSKSSFARIFQKWVINVIKDLRKDNENIIISNSIDIETIKLKNKICSLLEDKKVDQDLVNKLLSIDKDFLENIHIEKKIQQYDAKNFKLIKTFDSLIDVLIMYPNFSKCGIKSAALNNAIYNGYRWFFIESKNLQNFYIYSNEIYNNV